MTTPGPSVSGVSGQPTPATFDLDAIRLRLDQLSQPVPQGADALWQTRHDRDHAIGTARDLLAELARLRSQLAEARERGDKLKADRDRLVAEVRKIADDWYREGVQDRQRAHSGLVGDRGRERLGASSRTWRRAADRLSALAAAPPEAPAEPPPAGEGAALIAATEAEIADMGDEWIGVTRLAAQRDAWAETARLLARAVDGSPARAALGSTPDTEGEKK